MESIVYNDELYYFLNGAIYDSSYIALPLLESKPILLKYYSEKEYRLMKPDEFIQTINSMKSSGFYELCIETIFKGFCFFNDNVQFFRIVFPIITSCYRAMNMPQKAIDFWTERHNEYAYCGTPALYTSLGAAYCDLKDIPRARKCADIANAMAKSMHVTDQDELKYLYARLKKMSK